MRRFAILLAVMILASALIGGCQKSDSPSAPASAGAAPSGAATKAGWWIKIRSPKTECNSITFQIGPDESQRKFWFDWKQDGPLEFDVPADYQQVFELYISATANPKGKNASFCVKYKTHGVKKFDFDNASDKKVKQTDLDTDCID